MVMAGEKVTFDHFPHPAEICQFRAVNPHQDHFRAGFGGNKGSAVVNFHQGISDRHPSFREDHYLTPFFHFADQMPQCQRITRIHRNNIGNRF